MQSACQDLNTRSASAYDATVSEAPVPDCLHAILSGAQQAVAPTPIDVSVICVTRAADGQCARQ
jgi:hypothetical protein